MWQCWTMIFLVVVWDTAYTLKITTLYVPRGASHEAPIDCRYDLEGQPLYDVKWYKDDMQFFRCMSDGSVQVFPVDGVTVYYSNHAAVGSCPVKLTGLTGNTAGEYKCEVSLDAPTFRTASESRTLRIIQSSRRTQVQNETIRSPIKNLTQISIGSSNSGRQRSTNVLNSFLVFFIIFCRF